MTYLALLLLIIAGILNVYSSIVYHRLYNDHIVNNGSRISTRELRKALHKDLNPEDIGAIRRVLNFQKIAVYACCFGVACAFLSIFM